MPDFGGERTLLELLSKGLNGPYTRDIREILFNGYKGYETCGEGLFWPYLLFVERPNGNIYEIVVFSGACSVNDINSQILSTFRFVEKEVRNSGIRGITSSFFSGGLPESGRAGGPTSLEFAIAPIEGEEPAYGKAIFITSDATGKYEIVLPPGKYWVGSKRKALSPDPINYTSGAVGFVEQEVVVKEGAYTKVDISQFAAAP